MLDTITVTGPHTEKTLNELLDLALGSPEVRGYVELYYHIYIFLLPLYSFIDG